MMEKLLPKNHPRFCAKYVEFVGIAETPRWQKWSTLRINDETFEFGPYSSSGVKVGQEVYIVKMIPTPRSEPYKWSVHRIVLAESYWHYCYYYSKMNDKQRRTTPYKPYPEAWFGSFTNMIVRTTKVKKR